MTQENFCYLSTEPYLTAIYRQTGNHEVLTKLAHSRSTDEAMSVLHDHKRSCNDEKGLQAWDDLVSTTMANFNKQGRKHRWLSLLGRLDHIWLLRRGSVFSGQEPAVRVEVWRERTLYDGSQLLRLLTTKIHEVTVPRSSTS